jgi:hypothetical protein
MATYIDNELVTNNNIWTIGAIGAAARWKGARFQLDVSASNTDPGDLLDVYIQTSSDGGNWDDFIHFTQLVGDGSTTSEIAQWTGWVASDSPLHILADGAAPVGVIQGPTGPTWRARAIVNSSVNPTFYVTLYANTLVGGTRI